MSRHSRFLNLERPRGETGPSTPSPEPSRFGAIEGAQPQPAQPSRAGGNAERFRAADPAAPLELQERSADDQPFIRCARCEADNNAHAVSCFNCGASFNSPEQRAFNDRLWAQRQEERAREAAELAKLEQQRIEAAAALAADKRRMGEALAAEVAMQTRRRLDAAETAESVRWGGPDLEGQAARGLLDLLPHGLKQIALAVATVTVVVLLLIPKTRHFALVTMFVVVLLWLRISWGGGGRRRSWWL